MPGYSTESRLRQLSPTLRRTLGLFLAALLCAYLAFLVAAYFQLTPPSSLLPDLSDLDGLLLGSQKPLSRAERLLEATDGDIEHGGTMRPAFTTHSVGWEAATLNLSEDQKGQLLAQREGERLALLDWIRTGASRDSYDQNDHLWRSAGAVHDITPAYRLSEPPGNPLQEASLQSGVRVRVRSILADRCVPCHHENGRHDTARFIPLDSYEQLAPRLVPEAPDSRRWWVVSALGGLVPLTLIFSVGFWHTSHRLSTRRFLVAVTSIAFGIMLACWLLGMPGGWYGPAIAACAALAAAAVAVQGIASIRELFES